MLSDPPSLPIKTDITIGDFKFALNVGGIFDEAGGYVGNMLEWDDVTEARLNAGILSALDSAQSTMEFQPDGKITGANANMQRLTGYSTDVSVGQTLAKYACFIPLQVRMSMDFHRSSVWLAPL